ncbi:hypothetical protein MTO96_025234 [Rhipicephalus appendiculatus]
MEDDPEEGRERDLINLSLVFLIAVGLGLCCSMILFVIIISRQLAENDSATRLRHSLDYTADPCKDFYKYVCAYFRGENVFKQTSDLVNWMKSLNLDLLDRHTLATVNPVEMMVRGSLDLGVEAVISITFYEREFVAGKRLMEVRKEIIDDWNTFLKKYTNNTYTVDDRFLCPPYLGTILAKLFESKSVGKEGLQCLVAWTFYRQLFAFTNRDWFLRGRSARKACYEHVKKVMKLAVSSHYFQSEPFPDVPLDRLFPTWIKCLSLSTHLAWSDQKTILYDETDVNAYYLPHEHAVFVTSAIMHSPFLYMYGPISLNYGALGMLSLSREQENLDDMTDSENLCDIVGAVVAYAAYASLPEKFKSTTLAGLNASSEQLFFINHCLKCCAQHNRRARRYAPPRSRCTVPLMNMPEFSSAFGCAPGTPMNPRNKCKFW